MNTRHLLLLVALMSSAAVQAQNQVSVTPVLVPPYSSYLSDYQGALTVNLVNLTGNPQQVKLIGSLTGDNGYRGYTRSTYQPAQPIQLAAFETRLLYANSPALSFIDRNNFQINAPQQIQDAVMQTGILPEGNYELCIQAVDYTTNTPLSPEAPIGCIFFTLSYAQPPVLTFPWCGENIATAWPVFTWSPPIGNFNLSNIRYDLYLLELLPGQNPTNALWLAIDGVAGNPITRKDLMVPSYPWQPYDPALKTNTTYAVGVVARDISNTIVIENQGRSEVCTFKIESGPTPTTASVAGNILTPPSALPIGSIPNTRIKGRLVHVFKDSGRTACTDGSGVGMVNLLEGAVAVANVPMMPVQGSATTGSASVSAQPLAGSVVMGAFNYFGGTGTTSPMDLGSSTLVDALEFTSPFPSEKWIDRFPVSAVGGKPLKNVTVRLVERVVLEGVETYDPVHHVKIEADRVILGINGTPYALSPGNAVGTAQWHMGRVIATGSTDNSGNFDLFYHQPDHTGIPMGQQVIHSFTPQGNIGSNTTTAKGAYKVLMLDVVSPYYCSPDVELYPQPGDVLELPDQACYVRSYDLKVKVTQGACDQQMGGVGAAMGNVRVQVLRPTDHTTEGLPENEGQDLEETVNITGMGAVPLVSTCASRSSDGTALFRNLIVHYQQAPDEYLVRCSTNNNRGLYTYHTWQKPYPNQEANGPIVTQWNHGDPNERMCIRNSGFDVKLWELPVALTPRPPRVIGRVMVSVTQPLQDATVKLRLYYDKAPDKVSPVVVGCTQSTQSHDFEYMEFTRKTDANGFFEFSNILVKGSKDGTLFLGPHASIVVSKPGYMSTIRPLAAGNKPGTLPSPLNTSDPQNPRVDLKMGLQWDMTSGLLLEPYGLASGNVVNESGAPVRCDVQVGDGPWGRTEAVFLAAGGGGGGPSGWSEVQFTAQERFSVPGPPGFRPIKLIPLSDQYFPLTEQRNVPFNVSGTPSDLGTFVVKEKRHRLKVKLSSFDGPVVGAIVKVDDLQRTSDQAGIAFFEFLSPETEFRFKVDPPGDMMPVDRIIVNQVSPEPVVLEQMIETGTKLTGRVRAMPGDVPVANARVWVQIGSDQYGPQLNQVFSDENGEFILPGVPMGPFTVFAAKADPQTTYIGTSQAITYGMVPGPPPGFKMIPALPYAELTLQRVDDMDITHLLGFPVEVTALVKNNDGSSTIGGAFVQLPGNANFRLEDPAQRIPFANVKVTPGTPNEQGKPIALPANDRVTTDMTHVSMKLYTDLDVTLCGMPGRLFPGRVKVQGTPRGGEVLGTVSTELSSFNFSYDFSGRFYLGDGADQPLFDVFRSTAPYPQRSFNLMTLNYTGNQWAPANARFSLRGFEAHSDRSRSVVEPDVFKIATVIEVKDVPDITPEVLQLDVGNIRVNATSIEGIQGGGQELSFELNDWTFKSTAPWVFDNSLAAIVIPKGILDMELVKADMTQILIRPNGIEMKANNLGEVRLGGVAPLIPEPNTVWTFGYDPGYVLDGKTGVWRYGALTGGNATVATVQGPAVLAPSKLQFSSFSLVSRGAPLAEVRAIKYRYYDIMDVTPVGSMQFTPDAVDLLVNCSMQIKGLPTTTGFFSFFKEGGKTVSRLKPLGATVTTGRGNVYFKLGDHMEDQEIKPGQFTCYGRFRIDPEDGAAGDPVYAYGYLDHKLNNTYIDVIRVDAQNHKGNTRQEIRFGTSPEKKMLLNSGRQTMAPTQWNELAFKGNLLNMGGINDAPENELSFVVKGAVALSDGKISMSQLGTPFGNMSLSYDFEHARLVGSMSISNVTFGAVNILQATVGMLVDKDGFLVSVPKSHVLVPAAPWPLQDHHPAFMLGAHNAIPDTLLTNMMKGYRLKTLPGHMAGKKISGLYLQNRLDLLDFSVPSINLLVLGVEGHASCKVEGRTWVDLSGGLGMGGMAYADLGMEFWLLSPIPNCSSASVSAGVEFLFEAAYQNSQLTMTACGSASASASICGVGDSVDLTVKGSVNSSGKITLERISGSCGGQ